MKNKNKYRNRLTIREKHREFLFDGDTFNVFNLLRLSTILSSHEPFEIDISNLSTDQQSLILAKSNALINLIQNIFETKISKLIFFHQCEDNYTLNKLVNDYNGASLFEGEVHFDLSVVSLIAHTKTLTNHEVKNIRGAVLLALVIDLLKINKLTSDIELFNEKSLITLHSAQIFLQNIENAKLMWSILTAWNDENNKLLKNKINQKREASNEVIKLLTMCIEKNLNVKDSYSRFESLLLPLKENAGISPKLFDKQAYLNVWFVDDQQANGWLELIQKVFDSEKLNFIALFSVEDVMSNIELSEVTHINDPSIALVDLRLSQDDPLIEEYNSKDLSGFMALKAIKQKWPGTPVMITSASNKLWNLEKSIRYGAMSYWRKSDELDIDYSSNNLLTAFDIHYQLIQKMTLAVDSVKYHRIFLMLQFIHAKVMENKYFSDDFKKSVFKYSEEVNLMISSLTWHGFEEVRVNNNIFLGVMELFNQIESHLWDKLSHKLLFSNEVIQVANPKKDKQVINHSLQFIDEKYNITGVGLDDTYLECKNIRNNLPVIHGEGNSIKTADIKHIENALVLVLHLVNELTMHTSDKSSA